MTSKAISYIKTICYTNVNIFGKFLNKVPLGIPFGPNVRSLLLNLRHFFAALIVVGFFAASSTRPSEWGTDGTGNAGEKERELGKKACEN